MQIILGILVAAGLAVASNLVSDFLAPKADKYKKLVWVVFVALIGFSVVLAFPLTNKAVSDKPEVSIHQTTGGQNSPAVVTGGDVTITTETKDQKEEKKK